MTRFALSLLLVLAAACEEGKDSPECRRLLAHIIQITPRPGGGGPETDPAKIQQIVAQLPVEDMDQCAAVKDPVKPGEPAPPAGQTPKVIACMQAATDVAALRACIPAKTE